MLVLLVLLLALLLALCEWYNHAVLCHHSFEPIFCRS